MIRSGILFLLCTLLTSDCAVAQGSVNPLDVPRRPRRPSPIASTIFLGDWWDYYNRGIQRFDNGDLAGAASDLQEALKLHPEESERARTYGVRFQEFYPKAELGAVLFEMGRYAEAIPHLQDSMQTTPFAQTSFYLHEARRQLALGGTFDKLPPVIELTSPLGGLITNQTSILVSGVATDDLYVDSIEIDGLPVWMEKAKQTVHFEKEIPLDSAANQISVVVTDLIGRKTIQEVTVAVDRQGPVLSLEQVQSISGGTQARITGKAFDQNVVSTIVVDGKQLPTGGTPQADLDVILDIHPSKEIVEIELTDGFGNLTKTELNLRRKMGFVPPLTSPIRVAAVGFDPLWLSSSESQGPIIETIGIVDGMRVYSDSLLVTAHVQDASGIESISINHVPVEIIPGKDLIVGQSAGPLKEGTNVLEIQATNIAGVMKSHYLRLHYKVPPYLEPEHRLSIGMARVSEVGGTNPEKVFVVKHTLSGLLGKAARFNWKELSNLPELMWERILDNHGAMDPASRPADLSAVDLVLDATLLFRRETSTLFLTVHYVQLDKSTKLSDSVVGKEDRDLHRLAQDSLLSLQQAFPNAAGEIELVTQNRIVGTLSRKDGVGEGMPVNVVRKGPDLYSRSGGHLGRDDVYLGEMALSRVLDNYSDLRSIGKLDRELEVGDLLFMK